MSLVEFIIKNSKLLPKEIINNAHLNGWDDDSLFVKLKEYGEYLEVENGEYIVTTIHGKLSLHERFDSWLEKRIDSMIRAL